MIANDIVTIFQELVSGNYERIDSISDYLFRQGCIHFFLSLNKESPLYIRAVKAKALNHICIRQRYNRCKSVLDALEHHAVSYALLKGAVLSKEIFNDSSVRVSGDIDILVRKDDLQIVKSLFSKTGFVQGRIRNDIIVPYNRKEHIFYSTYSHQIAPFICKTNNPFCPYVDVDINTSVFWGEASDSSLTAASLENIVQTTILGTTVHKLSPEYEWIALCLHHYKDLNSLYLLYTRGISITSFCDIYYYWTSHSFDLATLISISKKYCVTSYIYYCLFYTRELFGDNSLNKAIDAFYKDADHEIIFSFGLSPTEKMQWEIPFSERLQPTILHNYLDSVITEHHRRIIDKQKLYL